MVAWYLLSFLHCNRVSLYKDFDACLVLYSFCTQGKLHLCEFIWFHSWPGPLVTWCCVLAGNASIAGNYHTFEDFLKGTLEHQTLYAGLVQCKLQDSIWEIWIVGHKPEMLPLLVNINRKDIFNRNGECGFCDVKQKFSWIQEYNFRASSSCPPFVMTQGSTRPLCSYSWQLMGCKPIRWEG